MPDMRSLNVKLALKLLTQSIEFERFLKLDRLGIMVSPKPREIMEFLVELPFAGE